MSYRAVCNSHALRSPSVAASCARSLVGSLSTNARLSSRRLPRIAISRHERLFRCSISTSTFHRAVVSHPRTTEPSLQDVLSEKKRPQTLTEKIVQRHALGLPEGKLVRSGDYVQIEPYKCMSHDNTLPIMRKFTSIGATRIKDPKQLVFALDHDVQNESESNLQKYAQIQAFAEKHNVWFSGRGEGIGHQRMVEEGFAWPGTMCVASDSHSNMYGGVSALGTAIVRTDAASVFATGRTWWQVPPTLRLNLTGTLPQGVTGKDVIVALSGLFQSDALNHAVEVAGSEETLASLSVDDRLAISNMSTEWGALSLIFPVDEVLKRWLRGRASEAAMLELPSKHRFTHERIDQLFADPLRADPGAQYVKQLYLNLSTLSPYVSGPNSVKISTPLSDLPKDIKVDRAYIISCTNSRSSDIAAAAKVFRDAAETNGGKIPKIADGVKLYLSAASAREQAIAEESGDWGVLVEAGAIPLLSGCATCIGLGRGLLRPGEVGISASNRNFKGRMGSTEALCYLASPEVVAASALNGKISGPGTYRPPANYAGVEYGYGTGSASTENQLSGMLDQLESLIDRVESATLDQPSKAAVRILPGFPEKITGEIVFCDADNLNTDAIYPGALTYRDDVTKEEMANACMSNYDPEFGSVAKPNSILVSGFNFGCGSSREQAATALLAKQIPLVVAASFGNIFSRNCINNALLGLESPRLVERLRLAFSDGSPKAATRRTGWTLTWDVARSVIEVQEGENGERWEESVGEFPENLQDIIAKGGLPNWIKHQISTATAAA